MVAKVILNKISQYSKQPIRRLRKFFGISASDRKNAERKTDFEKLYAQLAISINESFHTSYDDHRKKSAKPKEKYETNNPKSQSNQSAGSESQKSIERTRDSYVEEIVDLTRENFHEEFSELLATQMSRGVLRQIEQQYRADTGYERTFDDVLTGLRWIAALIFLAAIPIILGIIFILIGESWIVFSSSIKFMLLSFSGGGLAIKESLSSLYGTILSMLDMMLISALVMMVTIGGYENTVSRIGLNHAYPRWFGRLDIGSLKIKVAQSIATISSIHLLLNFMMIDVNDGENFNPEVIMWTAIVHVIFVVSALLLAYVNRVSHEDEGPHTNLHRNKEKTRKDLDKSSVSVDMST